MPDLTGTQGAEINRAHSANALLAFIEVSHPSLPETLRYVTDVLPFVWRGETYQPLGGMELPLADDTESASRLTVTIPNIDRRVGQTIRAASSPLKVAQHILSTADFDLSVNPRTQIGTPEAFYTMENFETVDASYDATTVDVTIMLRDYSQAQFGLYATQTLLPGVRR